MVEADNHIEDEIDVEEDTVPSSKRGRGKNTYVVEKILDCKGKGHHLKYLVKWKGFNDKHSTWEPRKNLGSCIDLIEEFNKCKNLKTGNRRGRKKQVVADEESDEEEDTNNKMKKSQAVKQKTKEGINMEEESKDEEVSISEIHKIDSTDEDEDDIKIKNKNDKGVKSLSSTKRYTACNKTPEKLEKTNLARSGVKEKCTSNSILVNLSKTNLSKPSTTLLSIDEEHSVDICDPVTSNVTVVSKNQKANKESKETDNLKEISIVVDLKSSVTGCSIVSAATGI